MSSSAKYILITTAIILILVFRFIQVNKKSQPYLQQKIKISGQIRAEPVIRGQNQYFEIDKFKIKTTIYPKFHYGDLVEITGTVEKNLQISHGEIQKIGEKPNLLTGIFKLRRFLILKAGQIWPEPENSLLVGTILGQDSIVASLRNALVATGTIHVVVVSGQNVAILAGFLSRFLTKFFRQRITSVFVILAIIFYTILTGFQPPTIRAAIMGILAFAARTEGRENWAFWSLTITAFVMLIISPELISSISFELSFAATAGILLTQQIFAKPFVFLPKIISESLSVTLSAWIFVAPLTAFYFSQFTPITPVSNLLVVPVVPFLMIAGSANLILATLNIFLARVFAVLPLVAAAYFTFVTENLAKIPFASLKIAQINLQVLLGVYILLILITLWLRRKYLANK